MLLLYVYYTVWCRRTDELVDGPNASHITPMALDRWETRLEDVFRGRPFDMLDAALADTVSKFPVDIQVRPIWQYFLVLPNSFDLLDCLLGKRLHIQNITYSYKN